MREDCDCAHCGEPTPPGGGVGMVPQEGNVQVKVMHFEFTVITVYSKSRKKQLASKYPQLKGGKKDDHVNFQIYVYALIIGYPQCSALNN